MTFPHFNIEQYFPTIIERLKLKNWNWNGTIFQIKWTIRGLNLIIVDDDKGYNGVDTIMKSCN